MGLDRRNIMKIMGALSASPTILSSVYADKLSKPAPEETGDGMLLENIFDDGSGVSSQTESDNVKQTVSCIVIGAGNRGRVYSSYASKNPAEMKIVGVAEPNKIRNERMAKKFKISDEHRFDTWEDVFKVDKFADVVLITTPDDLHYGPAMAAMEKGYHLLLEKPVAQTWEECDSIRKHSHKYNRIVAVCHVLRYTTYFRKMKEVVDSGALGEILSVQHFEPVYYAHMAHSYVRGNWRRSEDTNPMILAKSCHDLDILRWIIDKRCTYISSFGSLKWFRKENAPDGSTPRCTDGCAVEAECPYSAIKIYHEKRKFLGVFDLPDNRADWGTAILKELKHGPYGRCVYHCDNDVVDHQIVGMQFEDEVTANFSMEGCTSYGGRKTRICGSLGDIVGDGKVLAIADFNSGKIVKWDSRKNAKVTSGHGGGDYGLVKDFLRAVSYDDPAILTSTIDLSMESHLMGFSAEESRLSKKTIKLEGRL